MGATLSAVGSWIKAGCGVPGAAKWLWEALSSAFQQVCDMFRDLVRSVTFCFNFEDERFTRREGEIGHRRVAVNVGVNTAPDQGQGNIENRREEMKNRINQFRSCLDTMEAIVDADPEHENNPETEANLERFLNSEELQSVLGEAINTRLD